MGKNKKNKGKAEKRTIVNRLSDGGVQMGGKLLAEKELLQRCIDNEDYGAALDQLSVMVKENIYDTEVLYQGAYCYFMLCDYDRAAGWLDNVLSMDPGHIKARLLLARLCILEDRTHDGLAIYNLVVANYGTRLTSDQQDEICDVLDYYVQHERDKLTEFPNLLKFMRLADDAEVAEGISTSPVQQSENDVQADTTGALAEIMAKPASMKEKMRILNAFAGGYFLQGDYSVAEAYLCAAMKIDEHDECTLKNLAVLYQTVGEKEKALQVASTMGMTDFALLARLK